jgi:FkbM family methyltransferase
VFAFEPSVFNLELLARNIYLNDLTPQVTIVPLALSDAIAVSTLNMSSTEWGGALSTFGKDYGHDGQALDRVFAFQTIGLSMVDAVERLRIPPPDYMKIDVDGIEHLILRGGGSVLERMKGLLIEINDDFAEQAKGCAESLRAAGLELVSKRHSEIVEESDFRGTFNQIWSRPAPPTA